MSQYDQEIKPLGQIDANGSCMVSFPPETYGRTFRVATTEESLAIVNFLTIAQQVSQYFPNIQLNAYWGFSHTIQTLNTSDGFISKPFSSSAGWIIDNRYNNFGQYYPSFCISSD